MVRKARLIKKGFVFKCKHKINTRFRRGCIKRMLNLVVKECQKIEFRILTKNVVFFANWKNRANKKCWL